MWELDHKEGWVPKNWCFWTVVLEKTLESPLDRKEIKPVNPKGISPEYSLERLMLKLKLQYFGHIMWKRLWCWRILRARIEEGDRGKDVWIASPTHGHEFQQILSTGKLGMLPSMGSQEVWHDSVTDSTDIRGKRITKRIYLWHCAIDLKLTYYCKSIVFQLKIYMGVCIYI